MADPRETRSWPVCVIVPNLDALGQIIWASAGGPKIRGCWGPPPWDEDVVNPQKHASPHLYYGAKFGHSMSSPRSVIMEIRQINLTLRVPPFKVTQGHWNRHGLIRYL